MTPPSFTRFAKSRASTLGLVSRLSQLQMGFAPGKGSWSVGEVLDHLIQVDRVFRDEFDELLRRWHKKGGGSVTLIRSLSDAGFSMPLVPKALTPLLDVPAAVAGIFVPRPLREVVFRNRAVPAKAPSRIRPTAGRKARELRGELADFADYVDRCHAEHADVDWDRMRYYNPLTGFTNVPGILSFIRSHERRHQDQIRDILASEGFPESLDLFI